MLQAILPVRDGGFGKHRCHYAPSWHQLKAHGIFNSPSNPGYVLEMRRGGSHASNLDICAFHYFPQRLGCNYTKLFGYSNNSAVKTNIVDSNIHDNQNKTELTTVCAPHNGRMACQMPLDIEAIHAAVRLSGRS